MQPYDDEWKKEWNATIGGSRAPAILGCSRFQNATKVYGEMFCNDPLPDLENSPDIRRGRMLEPIARELMLEQTHVRVYPHDQCNFVYHPGLPFAHCLPDGWQPIESTHRVPCELKVPRPATWQKAYLNGVPQDWMVQLQHTMGVTDTDRIHWACLNPVTMELLYSLVERDEGFVQHLWEVESQFFSNGQAGVAPTVEAQALEEIPKTEGKAITLDLPEAIDAARLWHEGKELLDEAQSICDSAKARLIKLTDSARVAQIMDSGKLLAVAHNIEMAGRETLDKKAVLAAYPDAQRFVKTGASYSQFRLYWRGDSGYED